MDRKSIPLASLGLSVLACALAVLAWTRGSRPAAQPSADPGPDSERLRELTDQTVALRADLDRFASASRDTSALRQPMEAAPQPASVPPELLQRLTGLEESVAALQRQAKQRPVRVDPSPTESIDLVEAQRRATDPRSNEQQKLAALKALRGQKVGGQNAISGDVVLSMIDLAEHSADASTREDVYRNLHGTTDPLLRDSMLRALANDPDARVRLKVAEDINTFLPDPVVVNALRQAADSDADSRVRARAQETLSRGHE